MNDKKSSHGGARPGAGRKSRFTKPTVRRTVHLPEEFFLAIEWKYGDLTTALEAIATGIQPDLTSLTTKERTQ